MALLIQTHRMHIELTPLDIVQDKARGCLDPARIRDPSVLFPELLQCVSVARQELPRSRHIIEQKDHIEIVVRAGLLSEQRIDPPSADQPDPNTVTR